MWQEHCIGTYISRHNACIASRRGSLPSLIYNAVAENPVVGYVWQLMHHNDFQQGAGRYLSDFATTLIHKLIHHVREINDAWHLYPTHSQCSSSNRRWTMLFVVFRLQEAWSFCRMEWWYGACVRNHEFSNYTMYFLMTCRRACLLCLLGLEPSQANAWNYG